MNRTKTVSIAPVFPLSASDRAAQRAATHFRGDSDPDMDEALRRVRGTASTLFRLEVEAAYLERDAQLNATVAAEIAAGVAA